MHNQVRIIAGRWRGRKIAFPSIDGLRPTSDRVRETLFNWLAPHIVDSHCLDCFAGSGALGFEALSRGAAQVTLIDNHPECIAQLLKTKRELHAERATILQAQLPSDLTITPLINIVFLDPPFQQGLLASYCQWLEQQSWLSPTATIYIETPRSDSKLPIPETWQILKAKHTQHVDYYLVQRVCP